MKRSFTIFYLAGILALCLSSSLFAQIRIHGQVLDADDRQALAGASIRLKGSSQGSASDSEGRFSFSVNSNGSNSYQIQVSFVGYQTAEISLSAEKASEPLQILLVPQSTSMQAIDIFGTRYYPVTKTIVNKKEIERLNLGQDLPILLNFTPSIVTTSDAGAGIGYTGMRIRGSDPTRINVTINGIPLNDAESQGVFWVNMPDFASSVDQIQIQRGVGTSVNGAGAFGASVNIATQQSADEAGATIGTSVGSFNTLRHNAIFHTGLLKERFKFSGRLSKVNSDGFIDRAFSDLKSFYVSGTYLTGGGGSLTANIFSGKEVTYQAWNGVPESVLREGNRTFNSLTYENEVDNYQQDHYQLIWDQPLGQRFRLNTALHYTKGRGYYEQYRENDRLDRYQLSPVTIGGSTITRSDLIRRRWLDNDFMGGVWSLSYQSNTSLNGAPVADLVIGGGWNRYQGKHFGEVIWARFASNGNIRHRYYDNDATKTDFNAYAKANYQLLSGLFAFADLQVRTVNYDFLGFNNELENVTQSASLAFFNPKFGARYQHNQHEWYGSFAVANREPNRRDYTESTPQSRPLHETLYNWEAGYNLQARKTALGINFYYMNYRNQLVLTGQVNDVGGYIRANIDKSYRAGVELQGAATLHRHIKWEGNLSLSRNKIQAYTEYLDNYDEGGQQAIEYSNTDIAFSPSVVGASQWHFVPFNNASVSLLSKYVGRQYLDNTQSASRQLDPYFTNDIRLGYVFPAKWVKEVNLGLLLNNIFNVDYESNGYTFGYISGGTPVYENFYYPQAGFNFLMQLQLSF